MKKLILILILCLTTGCEMQTGWEERTIPTTDIERDKVARHVEAIMERTPRTLSGHDQDWDDAIRMAEVQARATICRPTLWEWQCHPMDSYRTYTGRWKYTEQVKEDKP